MLPEDGRQDGRILVLRAVADQPGFSRCPTVDAVVE